ncbi:hypothetical protein GRI94_15435 [Erythrobacter jejuensis]|uniref:Uncharacterized protein n=1 Tax=Parerythrobacter jejuensis TaxID=795812 RepID=A0A845ASC9_9SPHN|nr:hypothetical protein [Parerythrobacter jejuensis]MXP33220.1 hypothetical protein [Parerythrobacter jejuensis]
MRASPDRPPSPEVAQETTPLPPSPTRILDQDAALRLRGNGGITLQWIGWEDRGPVDIRQNGGVMILRGMQNAQGGPGKLLVEGRVTEIGPDYFILDGLVSIVDTPDEGRLCRQRRTNWRFAVTQNRKYWRLREFEWCDLLTDYIDIYF